MTSPLIVPEIQLHRSTVAASYDTMWFRCEMYFEPTELDGPSDLIAVTMLCSRDGKWATEIGRQPIQPLPTTLSEELALLTPGIRSVHPRTAEVPKLYTIDIDGELRIDPRQQLPYAVLELKPLTAVVYQVRDFDLWVNVYFTDIPVNELLNLTDPKLRESLYDLDLTTALMHEI